MNNTSRQEPVGHTCPIIDAIKKELANAVDHIKTVQNAVGEHLNTDLENRLKEAHDIIDHLAGKYSELEEVRKANSKLRDWGNGLVGDLGQADDAVSELEIKLQEAQNAISAE